MSFPTGQAPSSKSGGVMVASLNIKEARYEEVVFTNTVASARSGYFYRFAPKTTGEIRVSLDVRGNNATSRQIIILYATFAATTTASSSISSGQAMSGLTQLDTLIAQPTADATNGIMVISTSVASATYVNRTDTISIRDLIPIYFTVQVPAVISDQTFIRNFTISYDLVR